MLSPPTSGVLQARMYPPAYTSFYSFFTLIICLIFQEWNATLTWGILTKDLQRSKHVSFGGSSSGCGPQVTVLTLTPQLPSAKESRCGVGGREGGRDRRKCTFSLLSAFSTAPFSPRGDLRGGGAEAPCPSTLDHWKSPAQGPGPGLCLLYSR